MVMALCLTPACASGMICGGSVGAGRKSLPDNLIKSHDHLTKLAAIR
jgi:hypothetical protein